MAPESLSGIGAPRQKWTTGCAFPLAIDAFNSAHEVLKEMGAIAG